MDALLNFRYGTQGNLKTNATTIVPGTVYITSDERAMYVDLPDGGDGKRIRIGDVRLYDYLTELTDDVANDFTELSKSALYYAQYNNPVDKI